MPCIQAALSGSRQRIAFFLMRVAAHYKLRANRCQTMARFGKT